MNWTQRFLALSGLSLALFALGTQAQDEPTMVILPDAAAAQAEMVLQDIVLPDEAVEGMAIAAANRDEAGSNAGAAREAALEALAEAQANAADAADQGLQTAMDAVQGARGDLGRANIPENLPPQMPNNVPPGPGGNPPTPPVPPVPPVPPGRP